MLITMTRKNDVGNGDIWNNGCGGNECADGVNDDDSNSGMDNYDDDSNNDDSNSGMDNYDDDSNNGDNWLVIGVKLIIWVMLIMMLRMTTNRVGMVEKRMIGGGITDLENNDFEDSDSNNNYINNGIMCCMFTKIL